MLGFSHGRRTKASLAKQWPASI